MNERRLRWKVCLLVAILASLPAAANASNRGSNTASGGTSAHPCDDTSGSQCVSDDSALWLADDGFSANWKTAANYAVSLYNSDSVVSAQWRTTQNFSLVDTDIGSFTYGLNGLWGWGQCEEPVNGVIYGGSDPNRWCKRVDDRFNESYSQTLTQMKSIACHEVGHLYGLRHSNESSGSCMLKNQRTILGFSGHDHAMLDALY